MDQASSRRKSQRAFRWMMALLVALIVGVVGWLAFSSEWPERLVEPPTQVETPSASPR